MNKRDWNSFARAVAVALLDLSMSADPAVAMEYVPAASIGVAKKRGQDVDPHRLAFASTAMAFGFMREPLQPLLRSTHAKSYAMGGDVRTLFDRLATRGRP